MGLLRWQKWLESMDIAKSVREKLCMTPSRDSGGVSPRSLLDASGLWLWLESEQSPAFGKLGLVIVAAVPSSTPSAHPPRDKTGPLSTWPPPRKPRDSRAAATRKPGAFRRTQRFHLALRIFAGKAAPAEIKDGSGKA